MSITSWTIEHFSTFSQELTFYFSSLIMMVDNFKQRKSRCSGNNSHGIIITVRIIISLSLQYLDPQFNLNVSGDKRFPMWTCPRPIFLCQLLGIKKESSEASKRWTENWNKMLIWSKNMLYLDPSVWMDPPLYGMEQQNPIDRKYTYFLSEQICYLKRCNLVLFCFCFHCSIVGIILC